MNEFLRLTTNSKKIILVAWDPEADCPQRGITSTFLPWPLFRLVQHMARGIHGDNRRPALADTPHHGWSVSGFKVGFKRTLPPPLPAQHLSIPIMTRGFDPPLSLQVLRSATTLQKQLDALKQLKNDIIGHEKRKHLIISNGVSELLSRCLALRRSRGHQSPSTTQSLDPVDQVKLQAL